MGQDNTQIFDKGIFLTLSKGQKSKIQKQISNILIYLKLYHTILLQYLSSCICITISSKLSVVRSYHRLPVQHKFRLPLKLVHFVNQISINGVPNLCPRVTKMLLFF